MNDTRAETARSRIEWRRRLRFRRDQALSAMGAFERALAFRQAPGPLRDLFAARSCIGGYCAIGSEAPVDGLLALAGESGAALALPYFPSRESPMIFASWKEGNPLETGPWRVPQPAMPHNPAIPDVLLCPLLGFDRGGNRLGQGGGHYDRYCASHPGALRIGIGWAIQETDQFEVEAHDQPLDAILTEREWIVTSNRL